MKNIPVSYGFIIGFIVLGLFLIKVLDISYPLTVKMVSQGQNELSVVGEGKVDVTPDVAFIDIGVDVIKEKTVQEVKNKLTIANNEIIKQLSTLEIDKKDITTNNYNIYPAYSYEGNQDGFSGSVSLSIKVKKIDKVSLVIEKSTESGATTVSGVRFEVDKPEKYREEARDLAIKNAREQAEKISKNLGIKLGKITNMVESSPNNYYPVFSERSMSSGGGGSSPNIEPGTQTVSSTVTLFFEKK